MVSIKVSSNVKRQTVIVDEHTTLRKVLEDAGVNYSSGITSLDGSPLQPGDMDKTFADFGITEKAWLTKVVKADNAVV